MKRRQFVGGLALAAGATACNRPAPDCESSGPGAQQNFEWNMVTSWPEKLRGLGTGVQRLADQIEKVSGGRLKIGIYPAGQLVSALEVFENVSRGVVQMGHDPSYYHRGKVPAAQYFTTIPFGQNANEINAWVYHGGGWELWRELYEPFGLVPIPAGNTGVQMAGWFNKEINSVDDLRGLKMRIPGLGGEVMQRAGVVQVTVSALEIFTALQTGVVDAAEWVGPYNDVALGLHRAAKYYYYPGWHEPGPMLQCTINKDAWDTLPDDLREIVLTCCQAINMDMQAEYSYGNALALAQLQKDPNVEIRPLPADVLALLQQLSREVIDELVARDAWAARIHKSFTEFQALSVANQAISEQAYLNARSASGA